MSDPLFDPDDEAATPITPDERRQLIPTYITTRDQLNEAEQIGIAEADRWAFGRKRDVLDEDFLLTLHKRMLRSVWKWAGTFRTTERNIGIEAYRIGVELRGLIGDVRYWVENGAYDADEIAVRFHHRLVSIHLFPNGNGRHARLAADLLAVALGRERFTWGSANLVQAAETRARYIAALRAADNHDLAPLIEFARS
ncbi:mobile mystery protein B [Brevundimonas sp. S1H14]|uniref:mobile mystery protein B n=1 Tax=Brevundimonas sp. S1H14 TaxID=3078084 RepID=UPI0039ED79DD